jgi:hypothetical protein
MRPRRRHPHVLKPVTMLVGKKASDDLRKTLDVRGGQRFQVRTYTQLIADSEQRYKDYIEALGTSSTDS